MKTPHVHAEVIKAWADGAEIEAQGIPGDWYDILEPRWHAHVDYRIKPTPKPDIVRYVRFTKADVAVFVERLPEDNLKLTFDGETGTLKLAEVL